ncbi:alpha/beta hydrolase [Sinomicrobium pectinilyticum]|uniref:Alpha/beta hydrolase n=1 Tax=Sinomicrobium pectinilyticum TaxID=1084421 RepID=A0A3N0EGY5_SINP1|nr:alpha/beta hydrolase [Sinomicrobium pectinilyticum]RNL87102.1 alpha/beta hydrolase [Sinomicrobium pectinilyticum]
MRKLVVCLAIILSVIYNVSGQNAEYLPVDYPENYTAKIDVVYTVVDGWEGRMDIYYPTDVKTPVPLVVNIHGGGWNHGVKESQRGYGSFFKNGYAVANVEYRLVDVATAPGAIEDIRCALVYLHKHAEEINIDTDNIVLMGGSAGGHLALMAGLLADDKKFDTNCSYDKSLKVAAIIDKYGVTDLTPLSGWKSARNWLGEGRNDKEFVKSVSPLFYVDRNSPPVFIVHGDADPIVPYAQSVALYKKLTENRVKTRFITIPGGQHGKFTQEEKKKVSEEMWTFLHSVIPVE